MKEELQRLRSELDRVESKVLPFGTYQGYRITDVVRIHPAYLVWVVNNVPLQPTLRENIIRVLREYKPPRWKRGDPPPARVQERPMEPPAYLRNPLLR